MFVFTCSIWSWFQLIWASIFETGGWTPDRIGRQKIRLWKGVWKNGKFEIFESENYSIM